MPSFPSPSSFPSMFLALLLWTDVPNLVNHASPPEVGLHQWPGAFCTKSPPALCQSLMRLTLSCGGGFASYPRLPRAYTICHFWILTLCSSSLFCLFPAWPPPQAPRHVPCDSKVLRGLGFWSLKISPVCQDLWVGAVWGRWICWWLAVLLGCS